MRLKASPRRPAFGRNIDMGRINVEPTEAPSGPLGCHERRSGAQKKIKHEIATPRHILDRIGNQPRWLVISWDRAPTDASRDSVEGRFN
jgi:hypothetical protein